MSKIINEVTVRRETLHVELQATRLASLDEILKLSQKVEKDAKEFTKSKKSLQIVMKELLKNNLIYHYRMNWFLNEFIN